MACIRWLLALGRGCRLDVFQRSCDGEGIGFFGVKGTVLVSRQSAHIGDGRGIPVHIGGDGGAGILFLAPSADALFHGILHVALPIEPAG